MKADDFLGGATILDVIREEVMLMGRLAMSHEIPELGAHLLVLSSAGVDAMTEAHYRNRWDQPSLATYVGVAVVRVQGHAFDPWRLLNAAEADAFLSTVIGLHALRQSLVGAYRGRYRQPKRA